MTRHPWYFRAAVLLLLAAGATLLSACYTLVQHPRVESLNYRRPAGGRCLGCHDAETVDRLVRQHRLAPDTGPWSVLSDPWFVAPDSTRGPE
jgi:hypothetical protein